MHERALRDRDRRPIDARGEGLLAANQEYDRLAFYPVRQDDGTELTDNRPDAGLRVRMLDLISGEVPFLLDQRILQGATLAHTADALAFSALNATFDAVVEERLAQTPAAEELPAGEINGLR